LGEVILKKIELGCVSPDLTFQIKTCRPEAIFAS